MRNPSDNTLAVGPNHVVQIVNSRMAVFSKKGAQFGQTGKVLYGPVRTNTIFEGFGGECETQTSGDSVVRYDQLAERWLYVLPIFRRPAGDPKGPFYMCYALSTGPDPLGRITATRSSGHYFRTIPGPLSGRTATTSRQAPATMSSRSMRAWRIAGKCWKVYP